MVSEKRIQEVLAEERKTPERLMYCSFAAPGKFLGAVILKAHGVLEASVRCTALGINPGGQVIALDVPKEAVPPKKYHNRLLSSEDIKEFWPESKSLGEWEDEEHGHDAD